MITPFFEISQPRPCISASSAPRIVEDGPAVFYTSAISAFGPVLMGATAQGLCFVRFGPTEALLIEQLQAAHPQAAIQATAHTDPAPLEKELTRWQHSLTRYLNGENADLNFPLDPQGTPFQRKVWAYLQKIPYGQVQSYSNVAEGIGQASAIRAVASACAANKLAIVIPCHRVIRNNGALGGYRWGLAMKQALLQQEQA